jgi:DNA polymerase-3 subunit beta
MQLTIERAALLKALGHVQSVVERRNTIPILSNLLVSAADGRIALSATDLDMEIVDASPAQVDAPGQVTAPAHLLYEIARKLPEGADVSLSYTREDPRLQIRAGRARFGLPVLPAGDFPAMSSDGLSEPVSVEADAFARLIDRTRFAMSTEETRYYLNGLYLHLVGESGQARLRAVATDTRRLALAETPAPAGLAGAPSVIIPRKTVGEVRRLLDDAGDTVTIAVSAQKVRFGLGHAVITSKLIDGSFPPYQQVLPAADANRRVLRLDNALFAAAVDRVATISSDQVRAVRLAVETGRMTLSVHNIDASHAAEEMEAEYEGEPFEVGFNARYVLDVTAQIAGEVIELRFGEHSGAPASEPALVLDPTDADVQYILMPLRA